MGHSGSLDASRCEVMVLELAGVTIGLGSHAAPPAAVRGGTIDGAGGIVRGILLVAPGDVLTVTVGWRQPLGGSTPSSAAATGRTRRSSIGTRRGSSRTLPRS